MHRRVPPRPARARRNLARVFSLTALVTATSLTMSVAQAAPTPAPAATSADPAPGPGYAVNGEVAHYDFDYGTDQSAPNRITGGPNAVYHNGAAANPGTDNTLIWGLPGGTHRTVQLDGRSQYASVPLTLPTDQSFTVSAWVLPNKAGAAESVITEDGSRTSGFSLRIDPNGTPVFAMPQSDADQATWDTARGPVPVPSNNDWNYTHLTGVFDAQAGEIRLYVNGVKVADVPHTASWKAAGQLEIGRGLTAGQGADYFPGKMAEVRIWQRALPDLEAANVAIPDGVNRDDVCTAGSWLHAGGPQVKALAAKALASDRPGLRQDAGQYMGYGPLPIAREQDKEDEQKVDSAQNARPGAWGTVTKPFGDGIFGDDYTAFLNPPNYFDPMQKFLLDTGERNFNPPPPPGPSQDALNQALSIAHQHQASEQSPYGFYHFYAGDGAVKSWSAYEIARFIRFGGFPTQAPASGSVEFRTEVEDLKTQWAACDSQDPIDPNHVLDAVVATASAEWQAEQGSMAEQRADIVAADAQAYQDVRTASAAMNEAQGQAYIVGRMLFFQKYWQGQPKSNIFYPKPEKFPQATAAMATAKKAIQAQLTIAQKAAASAKAQADKATAAQADAGKTALANGTPYGRGLTYALQSAQVTSASAAAAQSAAKAIEATLNAVSTGQADSKALYALIDTQAHAAQAEFQRAAAQAAADQAHNAAAAAAVQAGQAAQNAATAKADRITAEQAEATAKSAAADADAKLAVAQQEAATAASARQSADSHRADAEAAEAKAQQQQAAATTAMNAAQADEQTAADKASAARNAEAQAAATRDAAADAEQARDAALSRQKALDTAATAAQGTSDAQDARQAANDADTAAGQATDAASGARTAADQAGQAAIAARADATRATGAAQRSRAAADAAQADAATTSAAAATAHAAAADAINASAAAAQNVKNAEQQAQNAVTAAAGARKDALTARVDADRAAADSARTAGQAYAAAQYAAATRDAASAAVDAGNTAVALGTPYRATDVSAGLAVLVGEDSKTIAQQQADAAKARSDEAAKAAKDAQAAADKAKADAKAAAQLAANAAADAAKAAVSVQQARESAAQAAAEATAAQAADTATAQYNNQAAADAMAASAASSNADTDASAARASATQSEQDAAAARAAATTAEGNAATARGTATQADKDATAAEQSAANAQNLATQADTDAKAAEDQQRKDDQAALAAEVNGPTTQVPGLTPDEVAALQAQCGQDCVDDYNQAMALSNEDVLDWVKQNGGQILLDVLGVSDAEKCFSSGDVESCLWTAVNVAALIEVAGKIPAVSRAIIRITEGITKFLEEVRLARLTIDRLREIIDAAKVGDCAVEAVAGAAAHPQSFAAAMAPRAKKSKFCGIKRVAVLDADFCAKGMHINLKNGSEVSLLTDAAGELIGIVGRPAPQDATPAEINATIDAIKSDGKIRDQIVAVAREAIKQFNTPGKKAGTWGGPWGCANNRAAELEQLIQAIQSM